VQLASGSRLGAYEIVALLGAGGMGEVYRARDTKLGREVAVKVLPEAFLFDPDRVARFEREAKVLASLNHPHIAALYGMEESGGRHFLVMELVEGETLAERLARAEGLRPRRGSSASGGGAPRAVNDVDPGLPVEEALKIAHQMADALEAAHDKSVMHRDLKPANVKITPDENVKVLDFGLAKAMEPAARGFSPAAATNSPTLSMMATQAGVILGTAAYMSPEQAKGFQADHRSDVFSFGSVLYEMLTGRQPFQGDTAPEILASVLVREPDFGALPPNLNPRLPELLKRCLEKNPKRRWQAVGDLRAEVEAVAAAPRAVAVPTLTQSIAQPQPLWRRAIPVLGAVVVTGVLFVTGAMYFRPSTTPPTITRFPFTLAEGQQFTNAGRQVVSISPDGTQMVYVASQRLYRRSMSELEARPIQGTEIPQGVLNPVFSPDGRSIAFWSFADQTIKKIAVSGGAAVTICPADPPFGMSWGTDGILFGQGSKGIMRVSANGGKPALLVSVKGGELAYGPQILPGGQTVLFTLAKGTGDSWDKAHIVVQTLRSGERKILLEGGSDARYLPTGHIVYALGGVLFAVPFDLKRLEVTGGPVPIVEGIRRSTGGGTGIAHFSFSDTGSLIYIPGPASTTGTQADLALIDRKGAVEPLKLPLGAYQFPRTSPNGKLIAFATDDGKEAIVWIYDLSGTSSMRRLTFGGKNRFPIWSADGQRVAFQSDREGDLGIFWRRADGTGTAERLTKPDQGTSHVPESWSPKGERFLFGVTKGSNVSLWTFSLQDKKVTPFGGVQSSIPSDAGFSPDGRWVAYGSNETGGPEIYVQPFPSTGAKYQVSKNGGSFHPLWSPDGKELFYVPAPGQFGVVSVTTQPSITFGNIVPIPRPFIVLGPAFAREHDITPDGKRFVGVVASGQTQAGAPATPQIQVVLNWFEELKQRVPVR